MVQLYKVNFDLLYWVMLTGAPVALVKHKKKEFITIKGNFVDLFMD